MKRKLISVGVALVLVLSFSLVMAVPTVAATTHTVNPGDSIQDAIDAAGPDDIISVAAGTYVGDLTIPATRTNLELVGATGATIKGAQVGIWPTHVPGIDVLASGVKIHGFTIESPDYPAGKHSSGIIVGAANVEIYENSFVIKDDGSGDGWGVSIETYGAWAGDVSGLNIHHNTFTSETGDDKGSEGVYINYNPDIPIPAGTVTIANNTFGGQIFRAITTERSKTIITGDNVSSSFSAGKAYNAAYLGISISSPGANLNPNQDTVVMTGNTVNGFYEGIRLGGTDNNLTNISVTNNTVEMHATGIKVYSSASGIVVNYNNIVGNTLGVENADAASLNAINNWWGHSSGPGDATSGNVSAELWLLTVEGLTDENLRYDMTRSLPAGWSLVSPDSAITVEVIVDDVEVLEYTGEGFTTELSAPSPLKAIYVKTTSGGGVGVNYAVVEPGVMYSKDLVAGWNLISVPDMDATTQGILSQLRYATFGTQQGVGLTTLVSQGDYNQDSQDFYLPTLTDTDWDDLPGLNPLNGYWAYMEAAEVFVVIP